MTKKSFDYQGARQEGYSDDEISQHLLTLNPKFNYEGAIKEGYTSSEINSFLSAPKKEEEKGFLEKSARAAGQYALGAIEGTPAGFVYDLAVSPLAQKEAQSVKYREGVFEDIERLQEQKQSGNWDEKDQALFDSLTDQIKNPKKMEKFVQTSDLSIRGLTEKATGLDLKPEGVLEKAAHWAGFIKDPKKIFELGKTGLKAVDVIKAISPSGREAFRGVGAGAALEMAEQGDFGPIGTMAAAVVGDISGGFGASAVKGAKKIVTEPRKVLAEVAAAFTKKDKIDLQKDIIKNFKESNVQADIGTLTNSDLVKWVQSRLAQSSLTGRALDDLKDELTSQIKSEYKSLADSLQEARFATTHEAGEVAKEGIKKIRDTDLAETRQFYKNATDELAESAVVDSRKLAAEINKLEKSLKPGSIKSPEQQAVLDYTEKLKRDIYEPNGNIKYAKVKDLINNKIALNDIINYEVQGGSKQLLKDMVGQLDRSIISYGQENISFARNYINANKKFSKHAKTFRNKNASQLLNAHDPAQLMNKMNSVQGIRDIKSILSKTPEGRDIFDGLSRMKLDQTIGNNLVDSTTQQVKLGTFSKLLEKGKNREVIKEILDPQSFKRLERLQKNAGKLAESAHKFLNTSKSGVILEDAGVVAKALGDLSSLMIGNPWPLLKTGTGLAGARYLTKLIAEPSFLRSVEEIILASENNNVPLMLKIGQSLVQPIKAAINEEVNR